MVHNLPLPNNSDGPNPRPSLTWLPGIDPKGLALRIDTAQMSMKPGHVTKSDILDIDAYAAAEYAQYQCFVKIDCLEPLYLRLDRETPKYFSGNDFAASLMKGFAYANVPPRGSLKYVNWMVEPIVPVEPIDISRMSVDRAKNYVLEMIELAWKVKRENEKVVVALPDANRLQQEKERQAEATDDDRRASGQQKKIDGNSDARFLSGPSSYASGAAQKARTGLDGQYWLSGR